MVEVVESGKNRKMPSDRWSSISTYNCAIFKKVACNWLFLWLFVTECDMLCLFNPIGEGLVPEQEDEVEKSERWPAGGGSTGERTGECEKGDTAAIRVLWHCSTPPFDGLLSQWRQSRQRPELRARSVMMYTHPSLPPTVWGPTMMYIRKQSCHAGKM